MLEHLVLYPRGGICNRLRAIASAKRLCAQTGALCTVLWDWGDYRALFDDDTEWLPYAASSDLDQEKVFSGYHHVRHLLQDEGGARGNRRVSVTTYPRVVVTSGYVFYAAEEPPLRGRHYEEPVLPWFPKPHALVLEKVRAFRQAHFSPSTAGMHIRRTDHKPATFHCPDKAYFKEADRLIAAGRRVFLATDNVETVRTMKERYGDNLLSYPKSSALSQRWPRETWDRVDVIDDMVDLWLLASCDFVIGSTQSSYSRVGMLLNGSPRCKAIGRPSGKLQSTVYRIWRLGSRLSQRRTVS
jgi:hypothetical protein